MSRWFFGSASLQYFNKGWRNSAHNIFLGNRAILEDGTPAERYKTLGGKRKRFMANARSGGRDTGI